MNHSQHAVTGCAGVVILPPEMVKNEGWTTNFLGFNQGFNMIQPAKMVVEKRYYGDIL